MCCSMMQKSENLLSHFITVHFFYKIGEIDKFMEKQLKSPKSVKL